MKIFYFIFSNFLFFWQKSWTFLWINYFKCILSLLNMKWVWIWSICIVFRPILKPTHSTHRRWGGMGMLKFFFIKLLNHLLLVMETLWMHFVIENCSNGENIIKILERKIIFQFLQLKIWENIPVPPHLTLYFNKKIHEMETYLKLYPSFEF